jgi:hypothetical protein
MRLWEAAEHKENKKQRVKKVIDGNGLIFFFKKGDSIFGGPEDSRLVFAKMKGPPDEDTPEGWSDDASFMAYDLLKAMGGHPETQNIFGAKDLDDIKLIEPEGIEDLLARCPCKNYSPEGEPELEPANLGIIKLKDKKKQ